MRLGDLSRLHSRHAPGPGGPGHRGRRADRRAGEHGQMMVLFTLVLTVVMGLAAMVIDVGVLRNKNQNLWNSLDAGALAGVSQLPGDGAAAKRMAADYVAENDPNLPAGNVSISFRCLVGDRNNDGAADAGDIGMVCTPTAGAQWRCGGLVCVAPCDPALTGNVCNTIVVAGTATVRYGFGNVIGVPSGTTNAVISAACKGPCGAVPTTPVDVVMIIDRTASMSASDVTATRDAAKTFLKAFDPGLQRVALGLLGPSDATTTCAGSPSGIHGHGLTSSTGYGTNTITDMGKWIPVGLSGIGAPGYNEAYLNSDGTLNTNSHIVAAINCFDNPGGTGTNLATPITMATAYLQTYGRPTAKWGIILETDGQPNYGVGTASDYTCAASDAAATAAKSAGIEVFTVGFGLDGSNNAPCPDTGGTWRGRTATNVLASMASQPSVDNGCVSIENSDDDHFFCQPKTSDLNAIFKTAAAALTGSSKLVQLP